MFVRQRQDLLDFNSFIEVRSAITGKTRLDQLKVWLEVDDVIGTDGIATRAGIWHRDDLDFLDGGTND